MYDFNWYTYFYERYNCLLCECSKLQLFSSSGSQATKGFEFLINGYFDIVVRYEIWILSINIKFKFRPIITCVRINDLIDREIDIPYIKIWKWKFSTFVLHFSSRM